MRNRCKSQFTVPGTIVNGQVNFLWSVLPVMDQAADLHIPCKQTLAIVMKMDSFQSLHRGTSSELFHNCDHKYRLGLH